MVNKVWKWSTGSFDDNATEEMKNVFNTNLFGTIYVMKAVLPHIRSQNSGTIINVTSIAGYMGLPFRGI